MYREYENPGQPLRSQAEYHNAGPVPARGDDASNLAHQQLAMHTAMAASIEWVDKLEENPDVKIAIDAVKGWTLKTHDPHLATELEASVVTQMALSCAAGTWDGPDPPGDRGTLCRSVLGRKMNTLGSTTGSVLESEMIGLAANLTPFALNLLACSGMFTGNITSWNGWQRMSAPTQATTASPRNKDAPRLSGLPSASLLCDLYYVIFVM
jgi:hypothetical protein